MEIELTSGNFEQEVMGSEVPVLVDFRAAWSPECAEVAPALSLAADKFNGKVKFGKVNIDNEIALTTKYSVTSVPTMVLFSEGRELSRVDGSVSSEQLEEFILSNIKGESNAF